MITKLPKKWVSVTFVFNGKLRTELCILPIDTQGNVKADQSLLDRMFPAMPKGSNYQFG